MTAPVVSVTADLDAPPSAVFAVLADPRRHAEIDGSGTVKGSVTGPDRLVLGSRFSTRMRLGLPYVMRNTVVEYEPDRVIAWHHLSKVRWRYLLEPLDGGTRTRVTEQWDPSGSPIARFYDLVGAQKLARTACEQTLPRLAAAAQAIAGPPSAR